MTLRIYLAAFRALAVSDKLKLLRFWLVMNDYIQICIRASMSLIVQRLYYNILCSSNKGSIVRQRVWDTNPTPFFLLVDL